MKKSTQRQRLASAFCWSFSKSSTSPKKQIALDLIEALAYRQEIHDLAADDTEGGAE